MSITTMFLVGAAIFFGLIVLFLAGIGLAFLVSMKGFKINW